MPWRHVRNTCVHLDTEAAVRALAPDFNRMAAALDLRGVVVTAPGDDADARMRNNPSALANVA